MKLIFSFLFSSPTLLSCFVFGMFLSDGTYLEVARHNGDHRLC